MSRSDWPQNPRLHPFRDAVWELSRDGETVGHLVSTVAPMRSLLFWIKQECVWFEVTWSDGTVDPDPPLEDYGPEWVTVSELERGFYDDLDRGRFDARPLSGSERDAVWQKVKDAGE